MSHSPLPAYTNQQIPQPGMTNTLAGIQRIPLHRLATVGVLLGVLSGACIGAVISFFLLYYAGHQGLGGAGITSGLASIGTWLGGGMLYGIGMLSLPVAGGAMAGYILVQRRQRIHHNYALACTLEQISALQIQLATNTVFFQQEIQTLQKAILELEKEHNVSWE